MQKMTNVVWALIVYLSGFAGTQSAAFGQWISAEELKNPPYILEKTGEKALLYKSGDRAGAALVVFKATPQFLLPALLGRIEKADGIAAKEEIRNSGFINMFEQAAAGIHRDTARDLWLHSWKADVARMKQAGFVTQGFEEVRIQSKPFNLLPSRSTSSIASFHVLNAAEMFGLPGSIVIVYRHDRAKEWGWHNLHDPFSFGYKLRVERQYTSREQDLVESVSKAVDSPHIVIPLGANPFPSYLDEWRQAKGWIVEQQAAAKQTRAK